MKYAVLLLLWSNVYAEVWTVKGPGAEFVLKIETDSIDFQGRVVQAKIPLSECNQALADSFINSLRDKLASPDSYAPEGINVQIDGQAVTPVRPRSSLGVQFMTMDDRFVQFQISQEALCSASSR